MKSPAVHRRTADLAVCALGISLAVAGVPIAANRQPLNPARMLSIAPVTGLQPLGFELNEGQTDGHVRFLAHLPDATVFLTTSGAVLALAAPPRQTTTTSPSAPARIAQAPYGNAPGEAVFRFRLKGANPHPRVVGIDRLPGTVNYFIGSSPRYWCTNVPTYAKVAYRNIYPGVDLVYSGMQGGLEYNFLLSPGTTPRLIHLVVAGAQQLHLDAQDSLTIRDGKATLHQDTPMAYQEVGGRRRAVGAHYIVRGSNEIGFAVGAYDLRQPLIIDPVLHYSTYLGGTGADRGYGIAVDSAGSAYVTGKTLSADFPTANTLQGTKAGGYDAFVAKLNADGNALVYSTYLGGSGEDRGYAIAVDATGDASVTGYTTSADFPTAHALQTAIGGGSCNGSTCPDAFVAKLSAEGNALVYSTYLGGRGDDHGAGIALDGAGNAYVTGYTDSTDFPTAHALQTAIGGGACGGKRCSDAFVAKLDTDGALIYSTYLGGSGGDSGSAIAADGAGNAYVVGQTRSTAFPTRHPWQGTNGGGSDVFVAKLNADGNALVYSTYLGGRDDDIGNGIAVDGAGNASVTGYTISADFPTAHALQATIGGGICNGSRCPDAFVAKLDTNGALIYSTYLGGSGSDQGTGIAMDSAGNAYVTGYTNSTDFPTVNPLQDTYGGGPNDAFLARLSADGSTLTYSTYLGGGGDDRGYSIAADATGNAYVTGYTSSADLATAHALQTSLRDAGTAYVMRVDTTLPVGLPPTNLIEGKAENVSYALNAPPQFPGLFSAGWYCPKGTVPKAGDLPPRCIAVDIVGPSGARDATQELFSPSLPRVYHPTLLPVSYTPTYEQPLTYTDFSGGPVFAALTYVGARPVIGFFFYIGTGTPSRILATYQAILGTVVRRLSVVSIAKVRGQGPDRIGQCRQCHGASASAANTQQWLVIPSNGTVVRLFLDPQPYQEPPSSQSWFKSYYTRSLTLSNAPQRFAHSGLVITRGDRDCAKSAPVRAAMAGWVIWSHFSALGLGYEVLMEHNIWPKRNDRLYTMYTGMSTHLDSGTPCISVVEGNSYMKGAIIGEQASSGLSTSSRVEWTVLLGPSLPATYDKNHKLPSPNPIRGFLNPVSPSAFSCTSGTDWGDLPSLLNKSVTYGMTRTNC